MSRRQAISILIFSICTLAAFGAPSQKNIFTIDLKKEIGGTTWIYVQKGFAQAEEQAADLVLIHMNTYGGEVLFADSIRTKILNSHIPVYAFIDNNAASAGALIAIACDKIFMRNGATIGAATVVNSNGEAMPDKYQSYMRATMRATAEAHGRDTLITGQDTSYIWKRNPQIAEAMVDERIVVEGVSEAGKTLTFTSEEALRNGYCEGIANNLKEVIEKHLEYSNYTITSFQPSVWDEIKGFFMSSIVQGILIMLIIGGIYFELQTPGIGFALGVAITAAVLYFLPLYIDGLAAHWEILMFIVGLVLLAIELFALPGFGFFGFLGVALILSGLTLSLIDNVVFNFEAVKISLVRKAIITVLGGLGAGFTLTIYLSSKIGGRGWFKQMALNTSLLKEEGYIGVTTEVKRFVGQTGVASTDLRPSGKIKVASNTLDAISEEGFIEKGESVIVSKQEGAQVYVVRGGD